MTAQAARLMLFAVTTAGGLRGLQQRLAGATPGAERSMASSVLDKEAPLLQDKPPVEALNSDLDGFHFHCGRPQAQMEAAWRHTGRRPPIAPR